MKIHGIQAKIIAWVLSVGAGFSFICSHIEMPSRIGQTPIEMMPRRLRGSGAAQGSSAEEVQDRGGVGRREVADPAEERARGAARW